MAGISSSHKRAACPVLLLLQNSPTSQSKNSEHQTHQACLSSSDLLIYLRSWASLAAFCFVVRTQTASAEILQPHSWPSCRPWGLRESSQKGGPPALLPFSTRNAWLVSVPHLGHLNYLKSRVSCGGRGEVDLKTTSPP